MTIKEAKTTGKAPCPRSDHRAAFLEDAVYVYGGYGGYERGTPKLLGDLHSLRVPTGLKKDEPYVWSQVIFSGPNTPGARAGMSLDDVFQNNTNPAHKQSWRNAPGRAAQQREGHQIGKKQKHKIIKIAGDVWSTTTFRIYVCFFVRY